MHSDEQCFKKTDQKPEYQSAEISSFFVLCQVETAKLKDVTSVNQLEFCNGTIETETQSNDNDDDDGDDDDDDDDDNNKEEEDDDDVDYDDDDDDDDRNVLSNSNGDGEASITNRDLDEVMQDVVRNKSGSSSASR